MWTCGCREAGVHVIMALCWAPGRPTVCPLLFRAPPSATFKLVLSPQQVVLERAQGEESADLLLVLTSFFMVYEALATLFNFSLKLRDIIADGKSEVIWLFQFFNLNGYYCYCCFRLYMHISTHTTLTREPGVCRNQSRAIAPTQIALLGYMSSIICQSSEAGVGNCHCVSSGCHISGCPDNLVPAPAVISCYFH